MTPPKHNNMLTRAVTGVVFIAVVLAAMAAGRLTYAALLVFVFAWCACEFWRLGRTVTVRVCGVAAIALCMGAMWFFPWLGGGMTGPDGLWADLSRGLCGGRFGAPPVSGGVSDCVSWGVSGWDARIAPAFMVVVWANDVFAYLVGVAFGRHKMCPAISPHKSWEGFAGGIVGATAVSTAVGVCLHGNVWLWIAFGAVVSLAAVGGDLLESRFKREAGVKDSGRLLPGHGGLLDRFDATLGAVPVAFLFFLLTSWFS
jgi:phosphatidate cytidylyltransferase